MRQRNRPKLLEFLRLLLRLGGKVGWSLRYSSNNSKRFIALVSVQMCKLVRFFYARMNIRSLSVLMIQMENAKIYATSF